MTFIEDPASQSLVKAFLTAVYSDEFITQCEEEFGFVRVGGELRDMALKSIEALVTDPNAPEWIFETDTNKRVGQGDYVISQKRKSFSELEQDSLLDMIGALAAQIEELQGQNKKLVAAAPELKKTTTNSLESFIDEEIDEDTQVMTALIMSSISIALWVIAILGFVVQCVTGGSKNTNNDTQKKEEMMEAGVN